MAAIVAFGAAVMAAAPAGAHALAVSSDPPAGSTVAHAPAVVTVTFGEQPDPALSSLRVLDSAGVDHTRGKSGPVPGDASSLRVAVGPLAQGVYTVAWRTVSKIDGHLAAGTFAFGVGVSPTGAAASAGFSAHAPSPSPAAVAGRWSLYTGLMVLVGAAVFALVCGREPPRRVLLVLGGGWLLAIAGPVVVAVDAWQKTSVPTSALLSSSIGNEFIGRIEPVIAAGLFLAAACLPRFAATKKTLIALVGASGLAAMWGDVTASHAAAAHSWRYARMAIQWAHFAAAGIWVGGLVTLVTALPTLAPGDRLRAAKRFSAIALGCVVVVAASGAQRAYDEVGNLHSLVHAAFGQYVLVKIGLFALLVVLGGLNRSRSLPALPRTIAPLRTTVRLELLVVAAVLVATGILQGLSPPSNTAKAPAVKPIVLTSADFATTVKVKLEISPGTAGFNRFTTTATDYDTGRPIDGAVMLTFALRTHPELGQASLKLAPQPTAGSYAASSANLSLDGAWTVTAVIAAPAGTVEVPFTVTTRQARQNITVSHTGGGLPDVFTLHLTGGRSVQSYLDPGHPGTLNEFHATFVGPDGQELSMTALTVTATPGGGLSVRRLDTVGHFVADLNNAHKGPYRFAVTGTTETGEILTGTFQISVT